MQQRRFHVLIADERAEVMADVVAELKRRGHVVAGAASGEEAEWWLASWPVDLLAVCGPIAGDDAAVLAQRALAVQPELVAAVLQPASDLPDGVAGLDASLAPAEIAAAVEGQLARVTRRPRWPRKAVVPAVHMQAGASAGKLVDVSYGGLKFTLDDDQRVQTPIEVDIPRADLRISADVVWSSRDAEGTSIVGAALTGASAMEASDWRAFVDRIA